MSHLEFTPNLANSNQNSQHNCSSQIIINETFLSYFQTLCKCASKFKFTPLSCLESLTNANCTFVKKKICLQERRSIFAEAHTRCFFASKVFFCKETLLSVGQVVFWYQLFGYINKVVFVRGVPTSFVQLLITFLDHLQTSLVQFWTIIKLFENEVQVILDPFRTSFRLSEIAI